MSPDTHPADGASTMTTQPGFQIIDGVPHIAGKAYPWAKDIRCNDHNTLDYVYRSRGFWLLFENGWTLSVQFGAGNYCANRDSGWGKGDAEFLECCPTAEIAAWDIDGKWWDFGGDEVKGWQTTDDVLRWIEFFSTRPSHRAIGTPEHPDA